MGLLKGLAKSAMKSAVNKSTSGALKGIGKTIVKGVASETGKDIAIGVGAAAVGAAAGAMFSGSGKKKNPLQTPPPPAIPTPQQSMSVMVAVNGQTYGPYERPTLLEMINNGTLTRETYIYMQGMAGWAPASQVPQVASLFGSQMAPPPAPPAPWASAPAAPGAPTAQMLQTQAPASTTRNDNTLSDRLNQLITAAVADGEITDMERDVLIRNAQEEGVSMDEFVMVLEARLYEQQQVLRKQMNDEARVNQMTQAHINATNSKNQPAAAPKKRTKCPHCGAPISFSALSCPECGLDYPPEENLSVAPAISGWSGLVAKLDMIDGQYQNLSIGRNPIEQNKLIQEKIQKKVQAIETYPVSTASKIDLLDFFTSCAPQTKSPGFFASQEAKQLRKAYKKKAEQILVKARIALKNDAETLDEIEDIASNYGIDA